MLLPRMWNVFKSPSFLSFVRLFWLLHRKPAHPPSRTIHWSFSRFGTRKLEKIYFNLLPLCAIICGIHSCFPLLFSALDLSHGVVYCFVCRDNVYDLDLEKIRVEQASRAWKTIGKFCCVHITSGAIHVYYVLKPLEFTSQLVKESGDVL